MRAEDFEFMYNLEETFWWFVAMREIADTIIAPQLRTGVPLRILDAGCGTGFNLRHYEAKGTNDVYGLDIAADAVDGVRKRGFSKVTQASISEIPFASNTFDLVFSFDVLSQVPADINAACIREMQRVLKPGGYLFIRAPAFEWMRSSHDSDLHTFHRFSQNELVQKLNQAGFTVQRATYANTFLFPIVVVRRFVKFLGIGRGTDVRPLPAGLGWIDPIFRRILSTEAAVFRSGKRLPLAFQ